MFFILIFGLFPLGLVAILASVQSARENAEDRRQEVQARVLMKAQRINSAIARTELTIRAASAAIALAPPRSAVCRNTLGRLDEAHVAPGRYALYRQGRVACGTPGYTPPSRLPLPDEEGAVIILDPQQQMLRFAFYDGAGQILGAGEFPRESLATLTQLSRTRSGYDLVLSQGGRAMQLEDSFDNGPLVRAIDATAAIAHDDLALHLRTGAVPIRPAELLMILLPIFMWVAAAVIGWLIVDRLLLRPLLRMQRAVAAYQPGDRTIDLPELASPAQEIGDLGRAFIKVTQTVARHEEDLEAALDRQTRLVREVHHRVKNNLQVVASLLNLHARGAANEEVAAAYASIQRRVDALAVVHRNHYAELEENRGVALRSLISELGANLRATAPANASSMQIRLSVEPYYVTQDVAVSVAFLITELVEFAMFCDARTVVISLEGNSIATARLSIESESYREGVICDEKMFERFDRVVTGLSRQLRSAVARDLVTGRYALDIAVVDKAER